MYKKLENIWIQNSEYNCRTHDKIKIHLITYANHKYEKSMRRLCKEAESTGWFDTITAYRPENLDRYFTENFNEILKQSRGAGYWIWKPYIIKKKLNEINDNDILVYLDAGCSINAKGKQRFYEYIDLLNNNDQDSISFQMVWNTEKYWTTQQIFDYFNIDTDSQIANTGQLVGGIRIMKKNDNFIKQINMELETLYNNPLLFTDYYNNNQQNYFIENRHDQSVFSIISKMNKYTILLNDETFFEFDPQEPLKYPFFATRIR